MKKKPNDWPYNNTDGTVYASSHPEHWNTTLVLVF